MTGGQAVVSATDKTLVLRRAARLRVHRHRHALSLRLHRGARSRFKTVEAYLDAARAEPGKMTYGTSGVGSTLHMAMELLLSTLGLKMTHVPYKGGIGAPYNDLVGGRLDMQVDHLLQRPAADQDRQAARPRGDLQAAPSGLPRRAGARREDRCRTTTSCRGWASPRRPACRRQLRDRVECGVGQAMARPDIKDKLEELGNDTQISTPSEFRARVEADMARWRPLAHVVEPVVE